MMRTLDLDLARRRTGWPAWLMLLIGAALAGEALFSYWRLQDEHQQLQERRAGPRLVAPSPKEVISEQTQRELATARNVLQELTLPWEGLFLTIEGALGKDTALLSIEPDAGKRSLSISGEARNYPAVLAFIARLEQSRMLSGVHLSTHQIREEVSERPFQFTVLAGWQTAP